MKTRYPVRAGSFYEEAPAACRRHAEKLLDAAKLPDDLPKKLYGGLVPHAGWQFSGRLAAMTFKALANDGKIETVVLLGADHVGMVRQGEVFNAGAWHSPLGDIAIDETLANALVNADGPLRANAEAHAYEHSLEVQIPLIQIALPNVKIVPIGIPPIPLAVEVGQIIGRILRESFPHVRVIGSTDLTHHGGHFASPGGHGIRGVNYARENDQRILKLITEMNAGAIIPEAQSHMNACGAGAIAAAIAATAEMGAESGHVLEYTNSYEVMQELMPGQADETTVGYASVVFA